MRKLFLLVLLVGVTGGCTGLADTIKAMGEDQTNLCGAITTVYGSAVAIRTNTQGIECSASGSTCTCRQSTRP